MENNNNEENVRVYGARLFDRVNRGFPDAPKILDEEKGNVRRREAVVEYLRDRQVPENRDRDLSGLKEAIVYRDRLFMDIEERVKRHQEVENSEYLKYAQEAVGSMNALLNVLHFGDEGCLNEEYVMQHFKMIHGRGTFVRIHNVLMEARYREMWDDQDGDEEVEELLTRCCRLLFGMASDLEAMYYWNLGKGRLCRCGMLSDVEMDVVVAFEGRWDFINCFLDDEEERLLKGAIFEYENVLLVLESILY